MMDSFKFVVLVEPITHSARIVLHIDRIRFIIAWKPKALVEAKRDVDQARSLQTWIDPGVLKEATSIQYE